MNTPKIQELSNEELLERQYRDKQKELRIGKTRAGVVKKQILESYEILENIRFDYVSDTAFREKIVRAKRELEFALTDFLLSENYWEENIKRINSMSAKEYDESLHIRLEDMQG